MQTVTGGIVGPSSLCRLANLCGYLHGLHMFIGDLLGFLMLVGDLIAWLVLVMGFWFFFFKNNISVTSAI